MLRALIGLMFLACDAPVTALGADAGSTHKVSSPASEVYKAQQAIIEWMADRFPEVEVDLVWRPCGERNAFYYPRLKKIVLCTEMEGYPGAAVMFAAHEMGHAITHQMLSTTDEQAADELAALAMIQAGYAQQLLEAAIYWKSKRTQGHMDGDSHPSAGYRAWFFACMGSWDSNYECQVLYHTTDWKWTNRLITFRAEE